MFLLCPGNFEENKTDLYVQTAESYWLKWPVNIDECMIYLSVQRYGSYFGKPKIYLDDKDRNCFDAIGLLKDKGIGYVFKNEYSAHARVECSRDYGCVCAGGVYQYRGERGGSGELTIIFSDSYLRRERDYVYKMNIGLSYNVFVKQPELKDMVVYFINTARIVS